MAKNNIISNLLFQSNPRLLDASILIVRCTIGIILFIVGAGKVLGWFGGQGMISTLHNFAKIGFSAPLVYLSSYTEFLGGFLLIIGLLTRPVAIAVTINMLVATITMWPRGFIFGMADFPFTILMCTIVILLTGPRGFSLDFLILKPQGSSSPKTKE